MTRRLELRPWRAEDVPDLYAIARDPQVGPAAGWQPHRSVEESAEVIRTVFASPETYAVVLRETGRPVGCVGLLFPSSSHFRIGATEAEVGYWIGTSWRGRGLMPEALGGLVRRAFEELELTALWGSCFVGNAASRRVMEKCGFRYLRTESGLQGLAGGSPQAGEILCLTRDEWLTLQRVYLRPATEADIPQIREVAAVAFPVTYREIFTPEQLDYMMEWMYSEESLRRQFREGIASTWRCSTAVRADMSRWNGRGSSFSICRRSMSCRRHRVLASDVGSFSRPWSMSGGTLRAPAAWNSTSTVTTGRCTSTNTWGCGVCARGISRSAAAST